MSSDDLAISKDQGYILTIAKLKNHLSECQVIYRSRVVEEKFIREFWKKPWMDLPTPILRLKNLLDEKIIGPSNFEARIKDIPFPVLEDVLASVGVECASEDATSEIILHFLTIMDNLLSTQRL